MLGTPHMVAVTVGKKISKNYQSYEATFHEEWTLPYGATAETADELRREITLRLKAAVNEELSLQHRDDPSA